MAASNHGKNESLRSGASAPAAGSESANPGAETGVAATLPPRERLSSSLGRATVTDEEGVEGRGGSCAALAPSRGSGWAAGWRSACAEAAVELAERFRAAGGEAD